MTTMREMPSVSKKQRIAEAMQQLPVLAEELGFERIRIIIYQEGRYWQFRFGLRTLANYWPGRRKIEQVGIRPAQFCGSALRAGKVAEDVKKRLLAITASALKSVDLSGTLKYVDGSSTLK